MKAKVYKRPGRDRWEVVLHWEGVRYRRYHYDGDIPLVHPSMAEQIAAAVNADIAKRKKAFNPLQWFSGPAGKFEFGQYSESWRRKNIDHYAPSVRADVNKYVHQAQEFFAKKDIKEIKVGDVEDFFAWLPERYSAKTKKNCLAVLHKIFSDAYRRQDVDRIPGFPRVQVQDPEIKWIEAGDQDRVIDAIPAQDRPIFRFIAAYGVRPGEARALQWDCIDFERRLITIRRTFSGAKLQEVTKSRNIRYLPLTDDVAEFLQEVRGIGGFVFRNSSGRPYTVDVSKIWKAAAAQVGVDITLYQGTRHSLASRLIQSGENMEIIRKILGHTTIATTQRYAKVETGTMLQALNRTAAKPPPGGAK